MFKCGKLCLTQKEAQDACKALNKQRFAVRPYLCKYCDAWHTTRWQPDKKRGKPRQAVKRFRKYKEIYS